jgi:hypothetical protein
MTLEIIVEITIKKSKMLPGSRKYTFIPKLIIFKIASNVKMIAKK